MTTSPDATPSAKTETADRPPEFVAVERNAYVFVAVLEDPVLDGPSNWLSQRFRVDPTAAGDDQLRVEITEQYHVGGRENHIAFDDQYVVTIPLKAEVSRPGVATVGRAVERWHRRNYLDEYDDAGTPAASPELDGRAT
jgi:hypothetical protein